MGRIVFPWGWPFRSAYYEEGPEAVGADGRDSAKQHPLSKQYGVGLCEHGKATLALLISDEQSGRLTKEGERSLKGLRAAHDGSALPDVSQTVACEATENDSLMRAIRRIDFII